MAHRAGQRLEADLSLREQGRLHLNHGIAAGWFDVPKATGATRWELARTGSDPSGNNNLASALSQFRADGFLTGNKTLFTI